MKKLSLMVQCLDLPQVTVLGGRACEIPNLLIIFSCKTIDME